eukprot:g2582.t1
MARRAMPGAIGSERTRVRTYHFTDPIQNLRIKVNLRRCDHRFENLFKTSSVHTEEWEKSDSDEEKVEVRNASQKLWTRTFGWQDKVFGPDEIVKYSRAVEESTLGNGDDKKKETRSLSGLQQEYHDVFEQQLNEENARKPIDRLDNVVLFNYVDKDGYVPKEEAQRTFTTSSGEIETPLAENVLKLPLRRVENDFDKGLNNDEQAVTIDHLQREMQFKSMHIVAAVDVDPDACREAAKGDGNQEEKKQLEHELHILCTIRAYNMNRGVGRLDVLPAFSTSLLEEAEEEADAIAAGESSPRRSRQERLKKMTEDNRSTASNRLEDMTQRQRDAEAATVVVDGVRWYRFTTKNGIKYEYTIINEGAVTNRKLEEELIREQRTKELHVYESLRNRVGTTLENFPPEGYCRLYVFAELVSAVDFNAASLYVQHELILPAHGWSWPEDTTPEKVANLSSGVTQAASVVTRPAGYLESLLNRSTPSPTAHFCYPIELELLRKDTDFDLDDYNGAAGGAPPDSDETSETDKESDSKSSPGEEKSEGKEETNSKKVLKAVKDPQGINIIHSMRSPQLIFLVISADTFGRHRLEGYGRLELPRTAGFFDKRVCMWKPEGSVRDRMAEYLLGGNRELGNLSYVTATTDMISFLNKYGFQVKSSGYIRIRLNLVWQSKPSAKERVAPESRTGTREAILKKAEDVKKKGYAHLLSGLRSVRLSSTGQLTSTRGAPGSPLSTTKTTKALSKVAKKLSPGAPLSPGPSSASLLTAKRPMDIGSITARLSRMREMRRSLNMSRTNSESEETKETKEK